MFYATAFVAALIAYVFWESPDLVEFRYGIIITILLMLLIASPLLSLVSSVVKFYRISGSSILFGSILSNRFFIGHQMRNEMILIM